MATGTSGEVPRVCGVGRRPCRDNDGARRDHVRALQPIDRRATPGKRGDVTRHDWGVG
jgi:hypothetical protein